MYIFTGVQYAEKREQSDGWSGRGTILSNVRRAKSKRDGGTQECAHGVHAVGCLAERSNDEWGSSSRQNHAAKKNRSESIYCGRSTLCIV
ncbi:hypothetical protein WN55_03391 [Dufourea novaeangliae]|uniref:Uncharacterized protein n=1 Tax=Dufourea novaeangliae TaxID=178035 RepID=A0A154PKR0_DUFNO|nr:hypothetical protein WN55_03391 [Dufourea novaeangliae]